MARSTRSLSAVAAVSRLPQRVRTRLLPGLRYLPQSEVRRCRCCTRRTVFVSLSESDEFRICLRCRANLRYEMLAEFLRREVGDLGSLVVLELAPSSPLGPVLQKARCHIRTYFSPYGEPGSQREDGARCEDLTRLSLQDASIDLIVSSEVLEHIADLEAAFRETARVLRAGGCHVFTVPPRATTRRRAEMIDGCVVHHVEPEFHSDPLDPSGILTYWDIGVQDAPNVLETHGLRLQVVAGPEGRDGRVVWRAKKQKE